MALFLKAVVRCDEEECKVEEEIYVKLDLATAPSILLLNGNIPPPPGWEVWAEEYVDALKLRCPECAVKRRKNRLKVVGDK